MTSVTHAPKDCKEEEKKCTNCAIVKLLGRNSSLAMPDIKKIFYDVRTTFFFPLQECEQSSKYRQLLMGNNSIFANWCRILKFPFVAHMSGSMEHMGIAFKTIWQLDGDTL